MPRNLRHAPFYPSSFPLPAQLHHVPRVLYIPQMSVDGTAPKSMLATAAPPNRWITTCDSQAGREASGCGRPAPTFTTSPTAFVTYFWGRAETSLDQTTSTLHVSTLHCSLQSLTHIAFPRVSPHKGSQLAGASQAFGRALAALISS